MDFRAQKNDFLRVLKDISPMHHVPRCPSRPNIIPSDLFTFKMPLNVRLSIYKQEETSPMAFKLNKCLIHVG